MSDVIIRTCELQKSFTLKKEEVRAVAGVNLEVGTGEILGFLGPNGAGKTTTLRMLTTLLPIDGGEATVGGFDVQKRPKEVRQRIGYVSQLGGADNEATGYEDLLLQGRLYGMSETDARRRVDELTVTLQLEEFAHRKTKTYSGGQLRRLNVACGIVHRPDVLFLDEPTTGLDPQNRANLWVHLRELRDAGTTIFLTTHYLDEADVLSDRLAIMDNGKIVAEGTPQELKAQIAGDAIVVRPRTDLLDLDAIRSLLADQSFVLDAHVEDDAVRLYVRDGAQALPQLFALLEGARVVVEAVSLSQPSLDDVFLLQTGRSLRDAAQNSEVGQ